MLEDFEEFDNTAAFLDELDLEDSDEDMDMELEEEPPRRSRKSMPSKRLMGMTPVQWFVISFEIFLMVAIMGLFFMVLTGRMVLPL